MNTELKIKLKKFLTEKERKLTEISNVFNIDGRNAIKNLRRAGIVINSRWVETGPNGKCKLYSIKGENTESHVSPKSKERR